jgi:hypothetical protein
MKPRITGRARSRLAHDSSVVSDRAQEALIVQCVRRISSCWTIHTIANVENEGAGGAREAPIECFRAQLSGWARVAVGL